MRKKIVAGNWKMNKTIPEALELVKSLKESLKGMQDVRVIIAPPFTNIYVVHKELMDQKEILTAAQNCHWEESGAFTGEVSASMVKAAGAGYVIAGHSERREYFDETDEMIHQKIKVALKNDLNVIFCCGEPLEVREAEDHFDHIEKQLKSAVYHIEKEDMGRMVIAYEPVWAIGTGKTATPEQAQEIHSFIRERIARYFDNETAEKISILYGGSCKPGNAPEIFACPDVDGGLIGGASLKAEDFTAIINSF